ncbi:MAG: UDP-N-acetylmuramoyl-L-alanyl-D-glutamate--2,6-diaminopimelate ligase [Candidatus Marinimicrobia bacterium]|nr:UDP-N-acetylmuramoyl-L-alanyl-D-glutamate--2,6-diaminopimelate ligase [Candidatus Neomarinimicrobiota bacterium]
MIVLKQLLLDLQYDTRGELPNSIREIKNNSLEVMQGDLFVALVGEQFDAHDFAESAAKMGAAAIVVERFLPLNIPQIKVKNTKSALACLADRYYESPTKKMKLAGITGTNGKTTVVYLLKKIFKTAGFNYGTVGTLGYDINGEEFNTSLTTPDSLKLQQIFAAMVARGVTHGAMEVSSHAIDLHRVDAIDFDGVAFTNLTQDHLDYHKTMANYGRTKAKLFDKTRGFKIANIDGEFAGFFLEKENVMTASISKSADFRWQEDVLYKNGIRGTIETPAGCIQIKSALTGNFNLQNILTAVAVAVKMGIDNKAIEKTLQTVDFIPGRLQEVRNPAGIRIFIDYAHTPDAIENVLQSLRDLVPENRRLVSLFGCGGNRDKTKRPKMAAAAEKYSDYCILTSDNPRFEDPIEIINDAKGGFSGDIPVTIFKNRKEAIEFVLDTIEEGDIFAILGKGHENYIDIKGLRLPFSEEQIIMDYYENNL